MPGVPHALARLTNTRATIFMLHRFSVPDLGISGHDPAALRHNLEYLRRARYNIISVAELFERLSSRQPLERTIVFTVDDGYFDQAAIAAPIFADFDCPVTFFVATGFLDRKIWFWWDRLAFIFEQTKRRELCARVGTKLMKYRWDTSVGRRDAWWDLNLRCQDASDRDRLGCIEELSRAAEVEVPARPPARFAPMSWDTARRLESNGASFGPHTVTHPVLGTTSAAAAAWEIAESWHRVRAEVAHPVPVFCYPNGRSHDIGEREIAIVRRLGLAGGLMAHPGELNHEMCLQSESAACRVPRFGYSDNLRQILQCVSGLENLKSRLRSSRGSAFRKMETSRCRG
jgi:peptidoglycan/xylan/chitin deacetylase (PgdA/CDA1 family)